ncbi:YibE/F family protein [Caldisalinibacter kiritimatiensis]|uniref:YibE/F family protein n=1 Tax=Caldisalinibacter kiritimatiensis TaxID=1304284 RepID=R1CN65_9FIRM|nr:YibE/F family protein [Caldisalinibacter kiritimatiensis]EOD00151.1 hypothetical protein L21TH_1802 [Caldisalinibacter kiritimatiensis]
MKKVAPIVVMIVLMSILLGALLYDNSSQNTEGVEEVTALVHEVDNSDVVSGGVSKIGFQTVVVEILEGKYKGQQIEATNNLLGQLELDTFCKPDDKIVVAIKEDNGQITNGIVLEHYRQDWEFILFAFFVVCLIVYARFTGVKALFSFVASLFVIWKFLIPGLLNGNNPLVLASGVLVLLSAIIIFSIAGFTKKGISAFIGTIVGLLVTIGLTLIFGDKLNLNGMTSSFAPTLLFSGHHDLNMKYIFYAAIIIGASGAAMDIAMDVAASMEEIKMKKPDINTKELIQSGFNVGRAVIGTMTTTLLLAYSGGYLTLLMLFMTKNSSFVRILNLKIVASEIMRTVVGSIGLVLVAPITAIFAGWIYTTELKSIFSESKEQVETEI